MMNLKKLNLNYKSRIFCYILVITFIPIITLGVYSYRTYITEVMNKINVSNTTTVSQVKNRVDNVLINIRKSYIEAVEGDIVKWLLEEDIKYSDYSELVRAGKKLSGPDYYSEYIEGYTFINYRTEWVLSNRGMFKYNLINNKDEVEEVFHYNENSLLRNFWITNMTSNRETLKRETINLRNLSLVLKLPQIQKNPHGLLIVNISMNKLEEVLKEDLAGSDITVFDNSGTLIFTTNKMLSDSLYDTLQNQSLKTLEYITDINGTEYGIVSKESNAMDWIYVVSYNMELVQNGGESILSITFLILGIIIVILILAIVFTKRLYSPVIKLSNYVDGISPNKKDEKIKNEFDYIVKSIDNLVDNNTLLENLIISQQPQLMENFQFRLIRGDIKEEDINSYLKKLSIVVEKHYMVLTINIKTNNGQDLFDEAKQDALRIDTVETMPYDIAKDLFMPAICFAKTIICAVTAREINELEDKVYELYNRIDDFVFSKYKFHISMGVSSPFNELKLYGNAYYESIGALKDNDIFNKKQELCQNEIMFYSDITTKDSGFSYERLLEREIKEAVDLGDKEKSYEIVDRFINSLIDQKALHNEISLSLQRFLIAIILVATDSGLQINQIFDDDLAIMFQRFNQIYDMDKIRSYMKYKIIEPIIIKLDDFRTSKSSEIMNNIQALIDETGGDITLTECAEHLNYHPTYIWKVMKVEKNTTFSNYVGEHKLEQAKKLLLETDLTVSEIATKLNYTNSQNFIRFFSKLEGITPGKFRLLNKKL